MKSSSTLLLVEDNDDDVLLMKLALKQANITNPLQCVEDGQQALDYLSGNPPFDDRRKHPLPLVVFLDLKLPIKSGHEVLTWIRKQPDFAEMVVIVLTSSSLPSDLQESYRLGANSYLVKPPTAEHLVELAKSFKLSWLEFNEVVKTHP